MSDKELIARGAELVTGDLILNRKVVGQYRNGQFILTAEGVEELENVVEVQAKEVATTTTKTKAATTKTRASRTAEPAATPEPTAAPADPVSEVLGGSLDDILKD